MLHVGFYNFVFPNEIVIILEPNSQPIKELVHKAKDNFNIIDATQGQKTRSIIVLKDGRYILSTKKPKTLFKRYMEYVDSVNKTKNNVIIPPMIHIGFFNYIINDNISMILNPSSLPTQRIVKYATEKDLCFDIRKGKKTKSVILLKSGQVIRSNNSMETINTRYSNYLQEVFFNKEEQEEILEEDEILEITEIDNDNDDTDDIISEDYNLDILIDNSNEDDEYYD